MSVSLPTIHILPHSYPFVMIDKIVELEEGQRIVCIKNVTINENYFTGHFEENPSMPAILIIEAMAQASGLIVNNNKRTLVYLAGIRDASFKRPVVPGDQIVIRSSIIQALPPLYVFGVTAHVRDEVVSEAQITLNII